MAVVDMVDSADAEDTVDIVETVEAVEPERATKVCGPIAKFTAICQIYAGSGNALRREETQVEPTIAFISIAGSNATAKSIASPPNV